jgi:hypothetical protein
MQLHNGSFYKLCGSDYFIDGVSSQKQRSIFWLGILLSEFQTNQMVGGAAMRSIKSLKIREYR